MAYIFYSIISRDGTRAFIFSPEDVAFEANLADEVFDKLGLVVERAIEAAGYIITDGVCDDASVGISTAEMIMARVLSRFRLSAASQGQESVTERVGEASVTRRFSDNLSSGSILTKDDLELLASVAGKAVKRVGHFDAY